MTVSYQPPVTAYSPAVETYIDAVLTCVPDRADRQRIEAELRARLDPRLSFEQASATYGEPRALAEFYLAANPLESAPFIRRILAAFIDIPSVIVSGFLLFYFAWKAIGRESFITAIITGNVLAIGLGFTTLILMSPLYYIISETTTSQTVGKALMGLRTVRESGAKISIGQAIVRQIPLIFSFYGLDILFALFTEKRQRLFEMISKTRVVRVNRG
jgi:uncharacterized RDD family membrane protein YckC